MGVRNSWETLERRVTFSRPAVSSCSSTRVCRYCKRLSNHISNILDYTEIAEGSLAPAQEEYMITSVLVDVVTATAIQSAKNQLELMSISRLMP